MNEAVTVKQNSDKTLFGFWVYLMTDCVLFASLFATYAVLHTATYGGPGGRELFSLPYVMTETLILLTSSLTAGLGLLSALRRNKTLALSLYIVTFILGAAFVTLEVSEFSRMMAGGNGFQRSAFLSSFFTLVGTHGTHISVGLLWMVVMVFTMMRRGLTESVLRKLTMLTLFWHFLDIVWIFIFTIVFLLGSIGV